MAGAAGAPGARQIRADAVSIRRVRVDDAAALADLYARPVRHTGRARIRNPSRRRGHDGQRGRARAALQRMRPGTGAAGAALGVADLEDDGHIAGLQVAPDAEGRHAGLTLYVALEAHARPPDAAPACGRQCAGDAAVGT